MINTKKSPLQYKIKITLTRDNMDYAFGSGILQLMKGVETYGNLAEACKNMGMAYSKAWKIIKRAEDILGFKLLKGQVGRGRGSVITDKGIKLMNDYGNFTKDLEAFISDKFAFYFKDL